MQKLSKLIDWLKDALCVWLSIFVTSNMQTAIASSVPLDRYEADIVAFEAHDKVSPPAYEGTVFAGSSTFALWKELEGTFRDLGAINRGFGGSTIAEINHYAPRMVLKYKPKRVVFYAGTNDINDGRTGQQVFQDFKTFVGIVHRSLPHCRVYFISASMAPSRVQFAREYDEANRLVREEAAHTGEFAYINVLPAMRNADGSLKEDYFLEDRLHMNQRGYAAWTPIIRNALRANIVRW